MQKKVWFMALLVVVLTWPLIFSNDFYLNVAIMVLINMILAVSLHLVLRTGHLSLASAALMGIGSYTSAILTTRLHLPFILGFLCAGILTAVISLFIGYVVFRLKGVYFVLMTFAMGEVIDLIFLDWQSLTGGANGIVEVPKPSLAGFVFDSKIKFYYLALAVTIASIGLMIRVYRSHHGRAYDAINQAENLAQSSGINTTKYKVQSFVISSFFAGIAGSLFVHYLSLVSPTAFTFWQSVDLVIMNVIVGPNLLVGPIIGAIILVPLPEFFRSAVEYQRALYGLTLIVIIRFLPNGISGLFKAIKFRVKDER